LGVFYVLLKRVKGSSYNKGIEFYVLDDPPQRSPLKRTISRGGHEFYAPGEQNP